MKKKTLAYYFLLSLLLLGPGLLIAQEAGQQERVKVHTDRTLYVAGEKIHFSAVLFLNENISQVDRSTVLYCELITPEGNRISSGKFTLEDQEAAGCLPIPEETLSGIYFLKSYTRYMRNGSPYTYHFIPLKIINPAMQEILSEYVNGHEHGGRIAGQPATSGMEGVILSLEKSAFNPREKIMIDIVSSEMITGEKYCLTAIPEHSLGDWKVLFDEGMEMPNNGQYIRETRGISLTGKVLDHSGQKPVPGLKVHLSIIGDRDIMVTRTDSSGRFFFALPGYDGYRDVFLCTEELPGISASILIDNDFCARHVSLPTPVFSLDTEEKMTAYRLAVNHTVSKFYNAEVESQDTLEKAEMVPFYGAPTQVLVFEKYIDLPALEDYFSELPFSVKVRKSQGKKSFRFYSTQGDMAIYDPLVMIDWVAVEDMEKILAMDPRNLDRAELVNAPYVKGSVTYGGIVSFVSKNNDFAGIDLPTSGTFISYNFFNECQKAVIPVEITQNVPDARNTVYWDPALKLEGNGRTRVEFPAPDTPGRYLIILHEMDSGSEIRTGFTVVD